MQEIQVKKKASPKAGLRLSGLRLVEVEIDADADLPQRASLLQIVDVALIEALVNILTGARVN